MATTGIAKLAASVGKPGRTQHLGNLHQFPARPTITGGDPLAHSLNHYGKTPPAGLSSVSLPGQTGVTDPTAHAGATIIRGGKGGIKRNPRQGGLGPGPESTPGGDGNYSMNNMDAE